MNTVTKVALLCVIAGLYFGVIIVFACVYDFMWERRQDSFVVNADVNEHPFEGSLDFPRKDIEVPEYWARTTLEEINSVVDTQRRHASILAAQIELVESASEKTEASLAAVAEELNETRNAELDNLVAEAAAQYAAIEAEHVLFRDALLEASSDNKDVVVQSLLKARAAEVDVEIANARVDRLREELRVRTTFSWTDLGDPVLRAQVAELQSDIIQQGTMLNMFQSSLREHERAMERTWYELRISKKAQLDWWDFLYFSVVTATTTGYGDIVPNTRRARMAVWIEIVICTVLLGLFLGFATASRSGGSAASDGGNNESDSEDGELMES